MLFRSYTVSGAVGGTVALHANGHTAVFTPGSAGLAGFNFTIGDGVTSVTRKAGVAVSAQTIFERRWKGGAGNAWDTVSENWINGSTIGTYHSGDPVVFDEAGAASATVVLNGILQPSSITVSGATNYTFTGSGALNVSGSLTNNGTLRLTGGAVLNVTGTFTNNGVLDLINAPQTLPAGFINNGTVLDSSVVKVKTVGLNAGSVVVTIQSYTGHSYQLQTKPSLTSGTWTNVGAAQAGATGTVLTFSTPGGSGGFYRVAVTP